MPDIMICRSGTSGELSHSTSSVERAWLVDVRPCVPTARTSQLQLKSPGRGGENKDEKSQKRKELDGVVTVPRCPLFSMN